MKINADDILKWAWLERLDQWGKINDRLEEHPDNKYTQARLAKIEEQMTTLSAMRNLLKDE